MKVALTAGLLAVLAAPMIAYGAPMGSPAQLAGEDNYAVTVEYESQNKRIDDDLASSWRWLTRIAWGVSDRFDLYARIGAANLEVDAESGGTFNGEAGGAYGLGGRYGMPLNEEHNIVFFADFQYLGYTSKGEMTVQVTDPFGSYTDRWKNKYWWGEYQFSALVVWQRTLWRPYGGLGLTWIDGKVDKNLYRLSGSTEEYMGSETSEFNEGPIPEAVLGMDFPLKGTGKFSFELRYSGDDISYFIGLNELWK
jgi:hypothetical protein